MVDLAERIEKINEIIEVEMEKIKVDRNIQGRVKRPDGAGSKRVLPEREDEGDSEGIGSQGRKERTRRPEKQVEAAKCRRTPHEKAIKEIQRLEMMPPMSAESTVLPTYLDWLLAMPWNKKSKEIRSINWSKKGPGRRRTTGWKRSRTASSSFLAVRQPRQETAGHDTLLRGSPGVGKTSLGKSIARATGRKFVACLSAESATKRRSAGIGGPYIGALPGQIIQYMKKSGTRNPVFMLDEVDKMSMDSAAIRPRACWKCSTRSRNHMFVDHYLDTEFDLSMVMFIATANVLHTIPRALQDPHGSHPALGYTENEKLEMRKRFLVRKQIEANGLTGQQIHFNDEALLEIIRKYTRESGVRNLEREIANVCRKNRQEDRNGGTQGQLDHGRTGGKLLGRAEIPRPGDQRHQPDRLTTGLAWTAGRRESAAEATLMDGKRPADSDRKTGRSDAGIARAAMTFGPQPGANTASPGIPQEDGTCTFISRKEPYPKTGPLPGSPWQPLSCRR